MQFVPCPFCSASRGDLKVRRQGKSGYRIICHRCGALGPYSKIEPWHTTKQVAIQGAINLWNNRA